MGIEYYLPHTTGRCLGCSDQLPPAFLDLGELPLANSYIEPENKEKEEPYYKLAVAYCPVCHLVQITHRVNPQDMFGSYPYFSSFSGAFLKHAETMAGDLVGRFSLNSNSLVMEVGSNDGYLLKYFQEKGIQVLGVEPAGNIARVANEKGITTMEVFFGLDSVKEILQEKGPADIVIGNNVLAHVPLINDFMLSVNKCLKPGGSAVFEFPYLKDLLENTEFDTIYHEHVFYYSLSAIKIIAERAGLSLYDACRQDIHGGSIRVFLQKQGHQAVANNVDRLLAEEDDFGITNKSVYNDFAERVKRLKVKLVVLLKNLKESGKIIAAYGAAAKGTTLLNYADIDSTLIDFVVDRSPYKQGKCMPGVHLPVYPPSRLLEAMPDYTLLLAWNFADEIQQQQLEYHERGGRFIIPVPDPRVV